MSKLWYSLFLITAILMFGSAATAQDTTEKKPAADLLYQIVVHDGVDSAVERYSELKNADTLNYDIGEQQLNSLGYKLMNEGRNSAAVAFFKINAENHPESINVWDSLGEGYLSVGKNKLAAEQYQKVLDMLEADTTMPPGPKNFFTTNAKTQLFKANHFEHPSEETLQYVSYYGGAKAGTWEMENLYSFKQKHDIKVSYKGHNLYRNPVPDISAAFESGYPGDVVTSFIDGDYRRFIEEGFIADISDLWEAQGWDEVFPASFKRMASYEGKPYFVPQAFQWNPVWYRKDIFEQLDLTPPETWQELLDLCDTLNEQGYAPFSISVQNWPPPVARWFTILNLRLNGPEFHTRLMKGSISYKDERVGEVFEHWRELFRHKAFPDSSHNYNYNRGIQALNEGTAVMYNLGEWLFESLNDQQGSKLDFFAFPAIDPDVTRAEIVHAYGTFMRAGTDKPEISEELLAYLGSRESQMSNAHINNRVVANTEVEPILYSGVQKRIAEEVKEVPVLVPLFEFNTHPKFVRKALPIFQEYWKNPEDIESAVNALEKARIQVYGASTGSD